MGVGYEAWYTRGSYWVWSKSNGEVWSKKEKTVAELMELCGDLLNQAWICGRGLQLNCDWEC